MNAALRIGCAIGLALAAHAARADDTPAHDMDGMRMSDMQGGRAPPDARDPDYSDGASMSTMPGMGESMNDAARFGTLLIDHLEHVHGDAANGFALDAQASYGSDVERLWIALDGERSGGRLGDTRIEAAWSHAASAFWDTHAGIRHDLGAGPARDWLAFGVQGLAPYWFDVEASAYLGTNGRSALRLEVSYDERLTQRLALNADLELNAYGKRDVARRLGAGVSNAELGLRLRYEITRRIAPYVGVNWNRRVGASADLARSADEPAFERAVVAGVRIQY